MKPLPLVCVSCHGKTTPFTQEEAAAYRDHVPEWLVVGGGGYVPYLLSRIFVCRDYKEAIAFIVTLSDIAEAQGHHPDFTLSEYKRLEISLTTHAAKGLTINDFVLATLIDAAWAARKAT